MVEGVPRRHSRTGKRGCFFIAQMLRKTNHAILIQQDTLGEHPIDISAERRLRFLRSQPPLKPSLHEDAADAVAYPNTVDAIPDRSDLSSAVRTGNPRKRHL